MPPPPSKSPTRIRRRKPPSNNKPSAAPAASAKPPPARPPRPRASRSTLPSTKRHKRTLCLLHPGWSRMKFAGQPDAARGTTMKRTISASLFAGAFRVFAFSTLLCTLTCYRGVFASWGHRDIRMRFIAYDASLESGCLLITERLGNQLKPHFDTDYAIRRRFDLRVPEPLGWNDGLVRK